MCVMAKWVKTGPYRGPVCHHDRWYSAVHVSEFFEKPSGGEIVSCQGNRSMQQVTCFWIDGRKQRELLTPLFDHGLVHQHDGRQVGGWPLTGLTQPLAEFLDPVPNRHL